MGDVSDMIFDGTLCQECGGLVYEGDTDDATDEEMSPGYPRTCKYCKKEKQELSPTGRKWSQPAFQHIKPKFNNGK